MKRQALHVLFVPFFLLIAGLAHGQIDRSTPPEAGKPPKVKLGDYESFTLDNGLKVFVVENHKIPKISLQLQVDRDPVKEGDAVGYVDMAGKLLRAGTENRDKAEIDEAVDFIGATLNTSSKEIFASSLVKHKKKLFEIFSDVLLNPTFPKEQLEKQKKQTISNLASQEEDANAIADRVGRVLRYGKDHPYGEVKTEESVKKITVDKLKEYYNTYFKPNTSYLAIVGDITKEKAKPLVKEYLGGWEKGQVPKHNYDEPKAPEDRTVAMVHKSGAVQSVINVTYPIDLEPGSKDAIKADVMNSVLGGGVFSGYLMQNLREDKGYTYGARSSISKDPRVGEFTANASVRNEVTDSSVVQFLKEMKRIRNEKVDPEHVEMVKNVMNGNFARSLEKPRTMARFALNIERYDLPKDYYDTYLEKLSKVDAQDVQKMAKKYIRPARSYVLVVGDENEVGDKLKKFGKYERYGIYGDPKGEKVEVEVPEGLTGKQVLKDYIEAIGGEEKIDAIKDMKMVREATVRGRKMKIVTFKKRPNKMKSLMKQGGMVANQTVVDESSGKQKSMRGSQEFKGDELKDQQIDAAIVPERKFLEEGGKVTLEGGEMVDGKAAYVVELEYPSGSTKKLYFDKKSGLKIRQQVTQEQQTRTGETKEVTRIQKFKNYKTVEGVKFPETISMDMGRMTLNAELSDIEVNPGLDDSDLELQDTGGGASGQGGGGGN